MPLAGGVPTHVTEATYVPGGHEGQNSGANPGRHSVSRGSDAVLVMVSPGAHRLVEMG
jgi:hypothetical protein